MRVARRSGPKDRHPRAGIDAKAAMRGLDQDALGMRAEVVSPRRALRRARPDVDGVRDQLLSIAASAIVHPRTSLQTLQ